MKKHILFFPVPVMLLVLSCSLTTIKNIDTKTPEQLAMQFVDCIRHMDTVKYGSICLNHEEFLWLIKNSNKSDERKEKEIRSFEAQKNTNDRTRLNNIRTHMYYFHHIALEYLKIKSWDSCQVKYYPDSISFDKRNNVYTSGVMISFRYGKDTAAVKIDHMTKVKDNWKMGYTYWVGHTQ